MRGTRLWLLIVPLVVVIAGIVLITQQGSAEPEPALPASSAQAAAFEELYRRYVRIQFDARVTGDNSLLPTVLYNDPTEKLSREYDTLLRQYQQVVAVTLERATGGPVGGDTGYLSAEIAVHASNMEQTLAWQAAMATASAEGRPPSISDLPEGMAPIEPLTPGQWVDQDVYMHVPVVWGNRGEAAFTFGTEALDGSIARVTYIEVEGRWYISAIRYEGTP